VKILPHLPNRKTTRARNLHAVLIIYLKQININEISMCADLDGKEKPYLLMR
jgi:hypothetical protein